MLAAVTSNGPQNAARDDHHRGQDSNRLRTEPLSAVRAAGRWYRSLGCLAFVYEPAQPGEVRLPCLVVRISCPVRPRSAIRLADSKVSQCWIAMEIIDFTKRFLLSERFSADSAVSAPLTGME
jgi:hypothetical protein